MATISLEDWEVEELGAVASNSKKLSDIVSRSASFGPKVGVDLARGICERVSLDLDETFSVIRGLARICFLRSRLNITSTAAVEVLTGSLEQGNKTKILTAWNGAKAEIVKALEQINEEHAIVVSIKADFVARSRPNILASARLFTESRPVFNE